MNQVASVDNIDLSAEIMRMQKKDGLEAETALTAADMYRKFLALRLKYGRGIAPSKLIDTAWHQHMADTEKYMQDCESISGSFIHHDPKITGEEMERKFAYTKELFKKEFGIDLGQSILVENNMATGCGS